MTETPKPPDYHPYEPWIDYVVRVSCSGLSVGEAIQLLAATELAALRAERDGLRKACADWIKNDRAVCQERDDLHAERDKYRAALEKIAAYGTDGICPFGCDTPHIARDALRPEGKP
jgi:uncharacterized protein YoaH (UPF0181 family)